MRFVVAIFFGWFIMFSCQEDVIVDNDPNANNPIHEYLIKTVENEDLPGLIAAIVDESGIRLIESSGVRKYGGSEDLTTSDLIHIGSCTKAMTSALVGVLVDKGLLTWETTVLDVFPEFENVIHEDFYGVSIHQLVTHRGGVKRDADNWSAYLNIGLMDRRIAIIKDNLAEAPTNDRGDYQYSNLGYVIAGSMLERILDMPWEEIIQQELFTPLGMTSVGFGSPGTIDSEDQPWGHFKDGRGWRSIQTDNPEALGPAGRVHTSFQDWAKFLQIQLPDANPSLLSRQQLNYLVEPVGNYAAGWVVENRSWANGRTYSHTGSNTMWFATVWIAPEINRIYMVATNSADDKSFDILDKTIGELIDYDP